MNYLVLMERWNKKPKMNQMTVGYKETLRKLMKECTNEPCRRHFRAKLARFGQIAKQGLKFVVWQLNIGIIQLQNGLCTSGTRERITHR